MRNNCCPICGERVRSGIVCANCGYDESLDHDSRLTLGRIKDDELSTYQRRKLYEKKLKDKEAAEAAKQYDALAEALARQQHQMEELRAMMQAQTKKEEPAPIVPDEKAKIKTETAQPVKEDKPTPKPIESVKSPENQMNTDKPKKSNAKVIGSALAAILVVCVMVLFIKLNGGGSTSDPVSIKAAEVGDTILFGSYEQDGVLSNGQESIEWIVLDKKDDQILVMSKYALDCKPYNTSSVGVTWETCSLREWLNGELIGIAFCEDESQLIVKTTVKAEKNPEYDTDPGSDTKDYVFLLSINEANKYFKSDEERKCVPTAYAIAQGAWTSSTPKVGGKATCWCWLRSPGGSSDSVAGVDSVGSVFYGGNGVSNDYECVRPALWIDLGS